MNKFIRQKDLVNYKIFNVPITVIGVGGIGSFTVLTLAKMGFRNITIYDHDRVEQHNLPNQFYRIKDLKKYKVDALADLVYEFEGLKIKKINKKWLTTHKSKGIIISAVDNMETREILFNYICKNKLLFIDGRMGKFQAEIYIVKPGNKRDIEIYKSRLWKNDQVEPIKCTEKAIIFNVVFIASIICNQIRLVLENKIYASCIIADLQNTRICKIDERK